MSTEYSLEATKQYKWELVKSITTVQAALGTDKSKATVEALAAAGLAIDIIDDGTVAQAYMFECSADADANTVNLYALREGIGGSNHYRLVATFTLTGGKQVIGSLVGVDTIALTASTKVWPTAINVQSQANDSVAEITLNTHGVSKFLWISTTLNSANLTIRKARL